ncbi:MAG TPA: carboxypeptidase-like regulatory domain-containing protein [Vicinamibacterales bacterium]|nr:carboxypeptidase-like regulatory domain-containing protein [Vicinamibacterales bacterium]
MRFVLKAMAAALAIGLCLPAVTAAQGGGASSTGTIQGRVTDSSGAVLPGVTVTVSSPSMLGTQTLVTNENGTFRAPAVPPGMYELTFELAGFNSVKRSGVEISLGFTANVNAELALATLQETVTVSGASPVIDTTATRVQQNFKLEQLNTIPNGRDMWSLLAATPGVIMTNIDIGGNRAGTQTGYRAYGLSGQVRTSVEGINTTEGTGGAGFYYDYGSFEEVFMGVAGQGAEAATPGVQSNFVGKSGSNRFGGEVYADGYNNSFQSSNLGDIYTRPTAQGGYGFRPGSNEVLRSTTSTRTSAVPSRRTRSGGTRRGAASSTRLSSRSSRSTSRSTRGTRTRLRS